MKANAGKKKGLNWIVFHILSLFKKNLVENKQREERFIGAWSVRVSEDFT